MAEHIHLLHGIQHVITEGEGVRLTFPQNSFQNLGMDDTSRSIQQAVLIILSPVEAISFNSWLMRYFGGCEIEVRNLGINRDLPRIKLEGIQSVTIQEFDNVLIRVLYRKFC